MLRLRESAGKNIWNEDKNRLTKDDNFHTGRDRLTASAGSERSAPCCFMNKEEIEKITILKGVVGSTCYGIDTGAEDRDELGICIEPLAEVAGLSPFEQFIYRSAVERTGEHNARSEKGDLDLIVYGLRKYVRLALKGNPTIIGLLFLPAYLTRSPIGDELLTHIPAIISKQAGGAFLGYMQAQRQRLTGERGGAHGIRHKEPGCDYDTKYAMHLLRLGMEGVELMGTGRITLPFETERQEFLLSVRRGEVGLGDVLSRAGELEQELKDLLDTSIIQKRANADLVEKWMVGVYKRSWL